MKENKKLFQKPIVLTLSALLCCALWGSATPSMKILLSLLISDGSIPSTILLAGVRFLMAGIITVAIYSIARKKLLVFKKENLSKVLTVGSLQTVLQYIFYYIGLTNTTSVKGTIASGTSAFFGVLVASLIFKQEKLTLKKIIACLLGFAGIVLINLRGLEFAMKFIGEGFVILSTVAYAFSLVFVKRYSKYEDPVVISGYQFIFGGAFMILLGGALGGKISFQSVDGVLILIYLAVISAVAYALWGTLLKYNPLSRVSVFSFSTPIFGTILSFILLSESSGVDPVNLIITLALVSGGILLLNYQKKEENKLP